MLDFLMISTRSTKQGREVYPKFIVGKSTDLMTRGNDFYAVYDEDSRLWSTDEDDVIRMIDSEINRFMDENKKRYDETLLPKYMRDSDTGMIDKFHKYCQKQCRQNFHQLDEKLIFSNAEIKKRDYATKQLNYPIASGSIDAYEELINTLYNEDERHKIEWAIGSVISGDSRRIQKFLVFYGSAGTGKSTVLNIIQQLFDGYYAVFDAKALGSNNNSFALEPFRGNPLVAIQHDGDLSHIEDNTRLNSLVSHEEMTVNEKFKSAYAMRFNAFLFMGTNKPVKITDGRSGLLRRLIDVSPTGNKVDSRRYKTLVKQIDFELGAIAQHCLDIYKDDPYAYDDYVPTLMIGASNDFYNFVYDCYDQFEKDDLVTLKQAWEMYKDYCDDARVPYPMSQRVFKEEMRNYFREFDERYVDDHGNKLRNVFHGFIKERFEFSSEQKAAEIKENAWLDLKEQDSLFDTECKDCPAQLASSKETPQKKWTNVTEKLSDLDTHELHYVKVPENHIVIDFDLKNSSGEKCLEKNIAEALKWPPTYAEVSKGGQGLHLHYIYGDDVSKLSNVYSDGIEIKVFTGGSSLRRRLSKCNTNPIITINSGLPFRKEKKMAVDGARIKSEKGLRSMIERNLNKEFHPGTKPSVDFINDILTKAYESEEFSYDVTDMRNSVYAFAAASTNQADYCVKLVNKMPFKSKETSESRESEKEGIMFFDVEVYPNLFIIVSKLQGEDSKPIQMINPTPNDVENLMKFKLVGFNNRRYDNHILYARLMGYSNEQLYKLSQKIISGDRNALNPEAYNVSYTDIYDFSSKKQSLKKFEIELGLHHQEMSLPWDEPVPEDKWQAVADYCINDVVATEAVWNARQADWTARQILADIAGMTVNDTTNTLTTRIIFGRERKPQNSFNYRNMGDEQEYKEALEHDNYGYLDWFRTKYPKFEITYEAFNKYGQPLFNGYVFDRGKSTYRDVEEVGEGGYVYAEPGMYGNVALIDVASMHPSSTRAEELFGEYERNYDDIIDARVAIKHKDYDKAKKLFNGKLAPYLNDESKAKDLAQALKIAINSVYGLTSATFSNPFKDERNKDNIVAKRGALFMINLRHAVKQMGFTVAHIKTDSIKIPDATPEIIEFVMDYGKLYGYNFEHEATYDRMCLVNNAVYIAKYATSDKCVKLYDYIPEDCSKHGGEWSATGTQFQVPYVFKKLFSGEELVFEDYCETKSVQAGTLYLDINEHLPDVSEYEKEWKKYESDYKKGLINDTMFEKLCDELRPNIAAGHNYHFVGKVGNFCPVIDGVGGGHLYREKDGKYYAAAGTSGYKWLESEMVRTLNMHDSIDISYFQKLANDASIDIVAFGNFDWFVSDKEYVEPSYVEGVAGLKCPMYPNIKPFN